MRIPANRVIGWTFRGCEQQFADVQPVQTFIIVSLRYCLKYQTIRTVFIQKPLRLSVFLLFFPNRSSRVFIFTIPFDPVCESTRKRKTYIARQKFGYTYQRVRYWCNRIISLTLFYFFLSTHMTRELSTRITIFEMSKNMLHIAHFSNTYNSFHILEFNIWYIY